MYIILSKSTTLLVKFFLTILNIDISNCICTISCLKHKPKVELMFTFRAFKNHARNIFLKVCVCWGGGGDTYPKYRMAKYRKKHSPIFKILIHGDWGGGGGVNA